MKVDSPPQLERIRKAHDLGALAGAWLLGILAIGAGVAQAQSSGTLPPKPDDGSLTYRGITLYGIVDIRVAISDARRADQ